MERWSNSSWMEVNDAKFQIITQMKQPSSIISNEILAYDLMSSGL